MAKPIRDPKYRAWIRSLPCCVCGSTRRVEAAHTGPHGMGQKSSDRSAIPLCLGHHRQTKDSYHEMGPVKFQERHGVEISALVAWLNERPKIVQRAGCWYAVIDGEEWLLRNVGDPWKKVVESALRVKTEIVRLKLAAGYDKRPAVFGVTYTDTFSNESTDVLDVGYDLARVKAVADEMTRGRSMFTATVYQLDANDRPLRAVYRAGSF